MTNCFSKIAQNMTIPKICDSKTSINLATILKTKSRHCHNHLAVVIVRENEVLNQSAHAIFDNHQCKHLLLIFLYSAEYYNYTYFSPSVIFLLHYFTSYLHVITPLTLTSWRGLYRYSCTDFKLSSHNLLSTTVNKTVNCPLFNTPQKPCRCYSRQSLESVFSFLNY